MPDINWENNYILFPDENARTVDELTKYELETIEGVMAIDCTWNQTFVSLIKNIELIHLFLSRY